MIGYLLYFVIVFLTVKLYFAFHSFSSIQSKLLSIPGPGCELLNGNLNLFYKQQKTLSSESKCIQATKYNLNFNLDFFNTLKAIAQIYRKEGIFKLRFGNKFIVCVFQDKHLKDLISSNVNISKSVEYDFLDEWLGSGLLLASHQNWFAKRSVLAKAFHKESFSEFAVVLNQKADLFLDKMIDSDSLNNQKTFQFTIDAISETLLRSPLNENENQTYLECIHEMASSFTKRALNPLLWNELVFKLTSIGKTYYSNLRILKTISKGLIMKRLQELTSYGVKQNYKGKDSVLDILLQKSPVLNDETLNGISKEVDTFLFAGHDTTALTINWILFYLGMYPEEQSRLRDEIRSEMEPGQMVQLTDLDRLIYLDCFVKECLRLHPPVPLIGRQISKEFCIGEHTIPKDTMLYVLIDQLHLDEKNFVSAHKFMPDRFLENTPSMSYMPFSAGPRNCIGKKFALVLIKILLVKVIQSYIVHSDESIDQVQTSYNIVLKPKNALKVRFTKCDQQE